MRVNIRTCQVIKLVLTGFVVVEETVKPSVLVHRPRKLGLYFKDLGLYIFLYNTKPVSMRIIQQDRWTLNSKKGPKYDNNESFSSDMEISILFLPISKAYCCLFIEIFENLLVCEGTKTSEMTTTNRLRFSLGFDSRCSSVHV